MKRLAPALLVASFYACAARTPDIRVLLGPDEGCPVVLLERSGGLGFEDKGGVIAAVWTSGTIVKAESVERPWGAHIVGRLSPGVLGELLDAASSDDTWSAPPGDVRWMWQMTC